MAPGGGTAVNLYQWEAQHAKQFEQYGDMGLSIALVLAAIVIILIAVFVRSPVVKALVLAYVVLP